LLQVRDPDAGPRAAAQGGPARAGSRAAAEDRVEDRALAAPLERRRDRLAGAATRDAPVRGTDVDLRGPSRLLAAQPARGQSLAHVSRAGRRAVELRARHGFHARRTAAGDGAPVLGVVGLSGDGLL